MESKRAASAPLWRDRFFWLALALCVFAVAPFLQPGYFWGANDARHHVYFLFEFDRLVQDGIWWPRWSPDFAFGYGYPFFNIYAPLSHFLAELLLHFGRFSHTAAIESIFGLSILASAGAMYGYVRLLAGRAAGLLAAVVYTYAPYHLLVLYVRGNLAESMAFVWLPICLWAFRQTVVRPTLGWVMLAAVGYAGLMLTSNLIFVLFTPLLLLYLLALLWTHAETRLHWKWLWDTARASLPAALAGLAGLGLSAIFWLPMALERSAVRVDQWFDGRYDFRDDFLYFFQLFSPRWGFGTSGTGPDDPLGFQMGAIVLLFALLGWLVIRRVHGLRAERLVLPVVAIATTAITLSPLAFLWELPGIGAVLQSAQFPWRWLPIAMLCLSVLAGFLLYDANGQSAKPPMLWLLPVMVMLLGSYPLLQIQISQPAEGPVGLAALDEIPARRR